MFFLNYNLPIFNWKKNKTTALAPEQKTTHLSDLSWGSQALKDDLPKSHMPVTAKTGNFHCDVTSSK